MRTLAGPWVPCAARSASRVRVVVVPLLLSPFPFPRLTTHAPRSWDGTTGKDRTGTPARRGTGHLAARCQPTSPCPFAPAGMAVTLEQVDWLVRAHGLAPALVPRALACMRAEWAGSFSWAMLFNAGVRPDLMWARMAVARAWPTWSATLACPCMRLSRNKSACVARGIGGAVAPGLSSPAPPALPFFSAPLARLVPPARKLLRQHPHIARRIHPAGLLGTLAVTKTPCPAYRHP